ncbi:MAG: MTH895/ArsE family thioredoxin-like protein [Armatimonadia bacterium]
MAEDLLTLAEAAEALGVSEITVKRYIYAAKMTSIKLPGGQHRVPRSEVDRLLSGGAQPAAEDVMEGLENRIGELEGALEHVTAELQVLAAWCARRQAELPELCDTPAALAHTLEVLGPGCRKCEKLYEIVQEVIDAECPGRFTITHVKDLNQITAYGPILTPALVIDGSVVSAGRVPIKEEVQRLLKAALSE